MAKADILLRSKVKKAQQALEQGRLGDAKTLYQQIIARSRNDADSWINLGCVHGQLGELADALRCFEKALHLSPRSAEAYVNLGKIHADQGQWEQAARAYGGAVKLKPDWPQALFDYANALHRLGRLPEAIDHYQRALALDHTDIDSAVNLAGALFAMQRQDEALGCIQQVLQRVPKHPQALLLAANMARQRGELDSALHHARQLRALTQNQPSAIVLEAQILERRGEWEAAYELIAPWLKPPLPHPALATLFARLCRRLERCDEAAALLETTLAQPMSSRQSHADLHYAAGEVYDTLGRYEQAFSHIRQANDMALAGFDSEAHHRYVAAIKQCFNHDFFNSAARATQIDASPLFIIGMPRSGTTLVEQILSSHPDVYGAGELPFLDQIARQASQTLAPAHTFPAGMAQLSQTQTEAMARQYLTQTARFSTTHRYISDKMPQNFFYLGLIAQLFPNAKIIHCQRHALDTCLSCYFQNFNAGQGYSNDLTTLAHYYNDYQSLMQHWEQHLPLKIISVRYEALVTKPETHIRQLLSSLDLPWHEPCLSFYNNKRTVTTASYQQVQQPLHRASIGRWQRYQPYLAPLLDTLHQ